MKPRDLKKVFNVFKKNNVKGIPLNTVNPQKPQELTPEQQRQKQNSEIEYVINQLNQTITVISNGMFSGCVSEKVAISLNWLNGFLVNVQNQRKSLLPQAEPPDPNAIPGPGKLTEPTEPPKNVEMTIQ